MEVYASQQPNMIIDENRILGTAGDVALVVVVPQALKQELLYYLHGTKLTGHYRKRRIIEQMRKNSLWRG